MTRVFFAIRHTDDPEELVETAALYKAMKDVMGDDIVAISERDRPERGDLVIGSPQMDARASLAGRFDQPGDYWNWEGFTRNIARSFKVCDFREAEAEVKRLSARGKGAFLKSLRPKHYCGVGAPGESLGQIMGPMVFSFCDAEGPCLMVQERTDFTHEARFAVLDGRVVASSPCAAFLTPLERERFLRRGVDPQDVFFGKDAASVEDSDFVDGALSDLMRTHAGRIASATGLMSGTVDVGLVGGRQGRVECVEINTGWPGAYGLYMCDPVSIAQAFAASLEKIVENAPDADMPEEGAEYVFTD